MPPITRKKQSLGEVTYQACTSWFERWIMSEISMAWISKRTQHILFHHNAPRISWSQQNLDMLHINIEIQGTYTEIEKGHQGPALPLLWMSYIFTLLLWCGSLLTQISSTYEIILSMTAAPVMGQCTSCPNVSTENTIRISVVFSYLVLLTPIVHYSNRGSNCKTAAKVNRVINVVMWLTPHEPTK